MMVVAQQKMDFTHHNYNQNQQLHHYLKGDYPAILAGFTASERGNVLVIAKGAEVPHVTNMTFLGKVIC